MDWKQLFISFIVGFGVGLYVGWKPPLINVFIWLFTVVSIGLVYDIILFLIGEYREKKRRKLVHSETIVNKNLEYLANTDIDYDENNDLGLYIYIKGLPNSPIFNRYVGEVNEHLKSGSEYKNVWNILQNRDELINNHNNKSRNFLNIFNYQIENALKNNFHLDKWDGNHPEPKRYFTKHITEIGKFIQFHNEHCYKYRTHFNLNRNSGFSPPDFKLSLSNLLVRTDNEKELIDIEKMISEKFDSALKSNDFIELKKSFDDIANKHKLFIEEISTIIKRIEYGIPLDGACTTCQGKQIWQV